MIGYRLWLADSWSNLHSFEGKQTATVQGHPVQSPSLECGPLTLTLTDFPMGEGGGGMDKGLGEGSLACDPFLH